MRPGLRPIVAPLRAHRALLWPLAVALLCTYAYFVDAPAWNQNSRLALTRALVEDHTTAIDPYHETTGDKSKRGEHFYCDKAPGISMVSVVPYAIFHAVRRVTGGELPDQQVLPLDPRDLQAGRRPTLAERKPGDKVVYNFAHRLALYLCGLVAVAIPSVAGAGAVWLLARKQSGGNAVVATVVALTYALATPIFPYATVLYGHGLCAATLVIALALVELATPDDDTSWRAAPGVWAGALLGLAVLSEYPAAVPALLLVGLAWRRQGRRFALQMIAGGIPFALLLAAYHLAAFGHPLETGYDFVYLPQFAEGMAVNYGIGAPQPDVALELLFGSYRGLLYLSPVLILASWGLVVATLHDAGLSRATAAVALAIVAFYVLLNAGYYMWDGGASFGPRHMVPMLGPLALGLWPAWRVVPRAVIVLAAVGVIAMLLGANANPEAPQYGNPVWEYAWERFVHGPTGATPGATNLGRLLGLPGPLSLVPLAALWWWAWPRRIAADDDPT